MLACGFGTCRAVRPFVEPNSAQPGGHEPKHNATCCIPQAGVRRHSKVSDLYTGHPLSGISSCSRGVIVLTSAYPHLQLTEPILGPRHLHEWPAKISSSWTLGGRKVECKSSRLSWLPSVSTWFVNFRSVKFQEADVRTHAPFDDLYLAVDTSDAVHIAKHDLRTAVQRQGKATAAHGHRVMVRGKRNTTHWRPACEAILQKL